MEIPSWKHGEHFEIQIDGPLRERALQHLRACRSVPSEPELAASVMIVRVAEEDSAQQYHEPALRNEEVFMLRRAKTMSFVPSAVVFPGGRVDFSDADKRIPWTGLSPRQWARQMSCSEETARSVIVASVREVFEECGILLAGADGNSTVCNLQDATWIEHRQALTNRSRSFTEILLEERLSIRSDLLRFTSHWITPEFEPRRYDTYFFAALLPEGQAPDARTTEAVDGSWIDPVEAFEHAQAGTLQFLPPTLYNLSRLAHAANIESFLTQEAEIKSIMLEPCKKADGSVVLQCKIP